MTTQAAATRHRPPRPESAPAIVDDAFLVCCCALALYALRDSYTGWAFLAVGGAGLLLGLFTTRLAAWATRSATVAAFLNAVGYLVLGPVVLSIAAGLGFGAPTPGSVRTVALTAVRCWKQLLTTQPPVGATETLLAVPFILGLVGAAAGAVVIRRTSAAAAPLAAPVFVLVLSFALGTNRPSSWPVTALLFTVAALGWIAVRNHRGGRSVAVRSARTLRISVAAVTLLVAGAVAAAAEPSAPGADGAGRAVLRARVSPPLDVADYPSPLNGFRKYTKDADLLWSQQLLTVSGLHAGVPLQIAVLDDYNGWVWGAVNPAVGDEFLRVASTALPTTADDGPSATVKVTIDAAYAAPTDLDVWLPTAGTVSGISLSGAGADAESAQSGNLWYDSATGSGIVTTGLQAGDTVTLRTTLDQQTLTATDQPYSSGALTAGYQAQFEARAAAWDQGANGPIAQVEAIAAYLHRNGAYSDGGAGQGEYLPGHGIGRLTSFLNGPQPVGDDEQYAATLALMAESLGLQARVVFGVVPEASGIVRGSDVHAWVQVRIASGAWADIPYTQFMPDPSKAPRPQPKQNTELSAGTVVPPPDSAQAPSSPVGSGANTPGTVHTKPAGQALPSWLWPLLRTLGLAASPVLAVLLLAGLIRGGKAYRRRRRRSRGTSADRFAAGWLDLVDHARDLGVSVPVGQTRRRQARHLPDSALTALAHQADAAVYGPGDPADAAVAAYWSRLDQARESLGRQAGRRRRIRAAFSLGSFLPQRLAQVSLGDRARALAARPRAVGPDRGAPAPTAGGVR